MIRDKSAKQNLGFIVPCDARRSLDRDAVKNSSYYIYTLGYPPRWGGPSTFGFHPGDWNREAELKPTTFSSLLFFRVFLSFILSYLLMGKVSEGRAKW